VINEELDTGTITDLEINNTMTEARDACIKMFEKIEKAALDQVARDKKISPFISNN